MPFKSKSQQAYLFIHAPKVAKRFAAKTTDYKSLPEQAAARKRVAMKKRKKRRVTNVY